MRSKHLILLLGVSILFEVRCLPFRGDNKSDSLILVNFNLTNDEEARNGTIDEAYIESNETVMHDVIVVTNNAAIRNNLRPGMVVTSYSIELEPNGDTFNGRALLTIVLEAGSMEEPVMLHAEGLNIFEVNFGITSTGALAAADFFTEDNFVMIFPPILSTSIYLVITYSGTIRSDGTGLYRGNYEGLNYLAMNLYPTYARRVFPCSDEPDQMAAFQFIFKNTDGYTNVISNAGAEDFSTINDITFKTMSSVSHVWGLVGHNFQSIGIPGNFLRLYGRAGMNTQSSYSTIMFARLMDLLEEYTLKPYAEIDANSQENCYLIAMPDITHDWVALSAIGVWEPYVLISDDRSAIHQEKILKSISLALTRQWFGYVNYPENWKYSWITIGLQTFIAYELADEADIDLDMDSSFVTDMVHNGLKYDGYVSATVLEADEDLIEDFEIRSTLYGIVRYKAPAMLNMLKYGLGSSDDYLRHGAVALLHGRALQTVNDLQFNDAINSVWFTAEMKLFEDASMFLDPWLHQPGYPVVTVTSAGFGQVVITQERFTYMPGADNFFYNVPVTWTVSYDPNFDNLYPETILDGSSTSFTIPLDVETDWIIFNLQRQGFYRVNYNEELWWRLIEALNDPDQREIIHPLNRAQLVDDAIALARSGRLSFDIAGEVALTVGLDTNYHVLKAGLDAIEFMRYPMDADEELDNDEHRRMVRRMVQGVEQQLGYEEIAFEPLDHIMARAVAMEYACKVGVPSCVAAALDLFMDGGIFNQAVPTALRPAVYCANVRESGEAAIEMLLEQYEVEQVHHEKLVILQSLACSNDEAFISSLLAETLSGDAPYGTGEREHIYKAVLDSGLENARIALRFIMTNPTGIRNMYGGSVVLERLIEYTADRVADFDMVNSFVTWINSINSNLEDSQDVVLQYANRANENMYWVENFMEETAEWIRQNDACTAAVSALLVACTSLFVLINNI